MPGPLENKRIILGVTGSIACYKALDLASKMVQAGALVDTVMSYGATQFVTPLAFRSITHRAVVTDSFDPDSEFDGLTLYEQKALLSLGAEYGCNLAFDRVSATPAA